MTPRRCTAGLLVALAGALLTPAAQACDCSPPGPPCVAFPQTSTVFAGRVTQISDLPIPEGTPKNKVGWRYRLVRFDVDESFRGQQRKFVEVTTGFGAGDCGVLFEMGGRYLVYADDAPQIGRLYTSICSRTKPMSEAGVDLDFLRRRGDPGRGAGIEGSIVEDHRDPKTNVTTTRGMMKGARVVVEASGKSWDATTDEQGWFRVWGLPAGEYTVRAVLSRNFMPIVFRKVRTTPAACGWLGQALATPYPFPQPK